VVTYSVSFFDVFTVGREQLPPYIEPNNPTTEKTGDTYKHLRGNRNIQRQLRRRRTQRILELLLAYIRFKQEHNITI